MDILVSFSVRGSEFRVRTVAERSFGAVLAPAEIDDSIFFRLIWHWAKIRSFVASIAERLGFARSTRTPIICFSRLDVHGTRRFLGNNGVAHRVMKVIRPFRGMTWTFKVP
jgi:hypothetical protein